MFGKIRASSSSLEGCPSKLLKDDSFSIYEATLMKLKLGAQRDSSARESSQEMEEIVTDSSDANMDADRNLPNASRSHHSPGDDEIIMTGTDTDCSSVTASASFSGGVSTGNSEQRKHGNVSILHFFKLKDSGQVTGSSSGGGSKNGSSGCVSSSGSVESQNDSEMESVQTLQDCCELSD
ncbi:uncharacterized protein LOC130713913 [Lotus japonicus]|uniref:uncharacterized protein LOC130713913 n=1 Tax=Lotus japonicus TaxID=34305 RepID=UPI00258C36E6|nr:uncharacterized protein LOC130713913 [Lotus japonicus]